MCSGCPASVNHTPAPCATERSASERLGHPIWQAVPAKGNPRPEWSTALDPKAGESAPRDLPPELGTCPSSEGGRQHHPTPFLVLHNP